MEERLRVNCKYIGTPESGLLMIALFPFALPLFYFHLEVWQFWVIFYLILRLIQAVPVGPLEASEKLVRLHTPFDRYSIRWDEVLSMYIPTNGKGWIYFFADGKQVAVPNIHSWKDENKAEMTELFNQQVEKYGIPVAPMMKGAQKLKTSRNAARAIEAKG